MPGELEEGRSALDLVNWWGPVTLWMGFIIVASGDLFSSMHTGPWLSLVLGLVSDMPDDSFGAVHAIVRKTAHLVEYGLLGYLSHRAFQCTWRDWPGDRWRIASLILALACATIDELHQSTILSRTGSPRDVLVDVTGAWLGIYLFSLLALRSRGRSVGVESAALDS